MLEPKSYTPEYQLILQWLSDGGPTALSYFMIFCQIAWSDKLSYLEKLSALETEFGDPGKYMPVPPLKLSQILEVLVMARNTISPKEYKGII